MPERARRVRPRFALYTPVVQLAGGLRDSTSRSRCARTPTRSTRCAASRSRRTKSGHTTPDAPVEVFVDGENARACRRRARSTARADDRCVRAGRATRLRRSTPLPFRDRRLDVSQRSGGRSRTLDDQRRDAGVQRGGDPRDVGRRRRRRPPRPRAHRSRSSSARTARPTTRSPIAHRLADKYPEVDVVEHLRRADYGAALHAGLRRGARCVVVNFDVDHYDLGFLDVASRALDGADGPAIVVGSKRGAGAQDDRPARASS